MNALAEVRETLAGFDAWVVGRSPSTPAGNRKNRRERAAKMRRQTVDPEIERARRTVRTLGADVWSAKSPADLEDILDGYANDDTYSVEARKVQGTLYGGRFPGLADGPTFLRGMDAQAAGTEVVPDILEGLRVVSLIQAFFRANPQPKNVPEADRWTLPVPILRCVIAHYRAAICLSALINFVLARRTVPGWLLHRVVRGWVQGERAVLSFLVMQRPDWEVPRDLLPDAERVPTLSDVVSEHNETQALFERLISESATRH
ncbi:MAG TPA: hypothetical protein VGI39_32055 [Polyangiaceae bacterium]|jgi:hypothetical protein